MPSTDDQKVQAVEEAVRRYHAVLAPRDTTYTPDDALRVAIEYGINCYIGALLCDQVVAR